MEIIKLEKTPDDAIDSVKDFEETSSEEMKRRQLEFDQKQYSPEQ